MKMSILLSSFLLLSILAIAQSHPKDSVIRNFNDLKWTMLGYYHPNTDSAKNNCWEGCVFIRFNINNQQFINVAYTATTPEFIKDAVAHALERINKRGVNISQLKNIKGKTYILPFMIENREGCGFMTGWEDNNYKPDEAG